MANTEIKQINPPTPSRNIREGGEIKDVKEKVDWFGLLNELSRNINLAAPDLISAINPLFQGLIATAHIDAIAVWTVEKDTNFMKIDISSGLSDRYVRFFNKTDRIRVGKGLVGRVISEKKTLHISRLQEYEGIGIARWNEMLKEEKVKSILAAPMFVGEQIIGAFNIYYKAEHEFEELEKLFTEILANQIAITLVNIKNYNVIKADGEKLKKQIALLTDLQIVTQYLNLHLHESVEAATSFLGKYITDKFESSAVAIFQKRETEKKLSLVASANLAPQYQSFLEDNRDKILEQTLVGHAFTEGTPQVSSRVMTDRRIHKDWLVTLSAMKYVAIGAFPLLIRERVIGVLEVYYNHLHEFTEEEMSTLITLSHFVGVSLDNIVIFQSLVTEKQNTQAMLDSLYDGIIVYDLEGKIMTMNPGAENFLSVEKKEVMEKSVETISQSSNIIIKNVATISSILLEDFGSTEIVISKPIPISLRITQLPLRDEKGNKKGSMRILHDVTVERAMDIIKSNFVSTASHQLRTPLTGIRWGLDSLLAGERGRLTKKQHETVKRTGQAAEDMIILVDNLLDVSRLEEGRFDYQFAMGNITEIIEKIQTTLDLNIKNNQIAFTIHQPKGGVTPVSFDREKIEIALRNIIDNALKYTQKGGRVDVHFTTEKDSLVINISDSGIGIPIENQRFLFNRFYRAKNAIKLQTRGSGLGLYIAKNIIERHNGRITFTSRENKGSTFSIYLPIKNELMPRGVIKGV